MKRIRQYRWSIHDIAQTVGKSVWAVRKDRQRGKVDLKDLRSLCRYVQEQQAKKRPSKCG